MVYTIRAAVYIYSIHCHPSLYTMWRWLMTYWNRRRCITVPFQLIHLSRITQAFDEMKFPPCNTSQALMTNQKFGRPCHVSHTGLPISHNPTVSADDEINKDEKFPCVTHHSRWQQTKNLVSHVTCHRGRQINQNGTVNPPKAWEIGLKLRRHWKTLHSSFHKQY